MYVFRDGPKPPQVPDITFWPGFSLLLRLCHKMYANLQKRIHLSLKFNASGAHTV